MDLRFTSEYYPDIDDITADQLAAARAAVVALLQPAFVDVDLAPGTPTGDLVVGPLALFVAVSDEAYSRLMSDLDLGNAAENVIFSCEFLRRYLGNFAVYDVENARSTGVARFTFDSDVQHTVDRHALFRFGGNDDYKLRMAVAESTVVTILPSGSHQSVAPDTYVLSQTSGTTWAVDLPLEGVMTTPVTRGTGGTTTSLPSGLIGLAATIDFIPGLQSASLPELARAARRVAYALNSGSRNGMQSLLLRNWPESVMTSPVITGDAEMLRTPFSTAMTLQAPAMDVFYRSSRDLQLETQVVRLDFVEALDDGETVKRFRGRIPFLHRPSKIVSLEWAGSTTNSYVASKVIYTRSARPDLVGVTHCGTRFEEFYVDLAPAVSGLDEPLIPRLVDDDGEYALFTVTYLADPVLSLVSSTLESADNRPAGVSLLVKAGPLVEVTSLNVAYRKAAGVKVLTTPAAARITEAFNRSGYPEPFRQTAIHDAMRIAGARRTVSINCVAVVSVTPAARIFTGIADPADSMLEDWAVKSDPLTPFSITDIDGILPDTVVDVEHTAWVETWAATHRTVRHMIETASITFTETA